MFEITILKDVFIVLFILDFRLWLVLTSHSESPLAACSDMGTPIPDCFATPFLVVWSVHSKQLR